LRKATKPRRRNPSRESFSKKKMKRLSAKKSPFLEFFHFNFLHKLKIVVVVSFLTPHVSANLTTVKFSEPAPPQGGSDCTVSVASVSLSLGRKGQAIINENF